MSFPRSVGQIPIYYNHLPTGRPYDPQKPEKYTSHYYDEANGPLFPFGYGLSYTHFTLSPVTLSATQLAPAGSLTATVTLTNDGDRDGATVVQLVFARCHRLHQPAGGDATGLPQGLSESGGVAIRPIYRHAGHAAVL